MTTEKKMISKNRILFLHAGSEWYGADKILYNVLKTLLANNECHVILPNEGILHEKIIQLQIPCNLLKYPVLRRKYFSISGILIYFYHLLKTIPQLIGYIQKNKIEILHSNTIAVLEGVLLSTILHKPHVWHIHETLKKPALLVKALSFFARNFSTVTLCVSKTVADNLGKSKKIRIIHNGIPLINSPDMASQKRLHNPFTIGVVGRFNAIKGQISLLQAIQNVKGSGRLNAACKILLIGGVFENDLRWLNNVKQYIDEQEIGSFVEIRDFSENIESIFNEVDLIAHPSILPDSFPTVVLEAMSFGVPVVGYKNGGICEMLNYDGECLAEIGDFKGIGERIVTFIANKEFYNKKRKCQHERFLQHFTIEVFNDRINKVYEEVKRTLRNPQ
jgi:glycosyltransferase involved in cell wall biosynthesis